MGGSPSSNTLRHRAALVAKIDAILVAAAVAMLALFGSWSLAGLGEAIWWVALTTGLVWGLAIVGRGGLREMSIPERSGVVMPGEMTSLLWPERWLAIQERLKLAALVVVPLMPVAWLLSAVG